MTLSFSMFSCVKDSSQKNETPVAPIAPPEVVVPTNTSEIESAEPQSAEPKVVSPQIIKFSTCSETEFDRLKDILPKVDMAHKKISNMGSSANWIYNGDVVLSAGAATRGCEALIQYHEKRPCDKLIKQLDGSQSLKQYSGETLRQRCEKTRSYYYEFAQNKSTLIFKNADLFLDVSGFSDKVFESNYIGDIQGCRVENRQPNSIDYSGLGLVKVKDTRGFQEKMIVMETAEGLLVQCYGLNIGEAFSKSEIVRVLRDAETIMPLFYKLK
jgi:hypothetical protein